MKTCASDLENITKWTFFWPRETQRNGKDFNLYFG